MVTKRQSAVETYDPSAGIAPTELFATIDLQHGEPFQVRTASPARTGQTGSTLLFVALAPVESALTPTTYRPGTETWTVDARYPLSAYAAFAATQSHYVRAADPRLASYSAEIAAAQRGKAAAWKQLADGAITPKDLSDRLRSLNALIDSLGQARDAAATTTSSPFSIHENSLFAAPGTIYTLRFVPTVTHGQVAATLTTSGTGHGAVALRCGSASSSKMVSMAEDTSAYGKTVPGRARLTIRYDSSPFGVNTISIAASGSHMSGWSADQYLPAGVYRWKAARGSIDSVAIDGRVRPNAQPTTLASGYHHIVVSGDSHFGALEFASASFTPPSGAQQRPVSQLSPIAWATRVDRPTTLELAQISDGNWYAKVGSAKYEGYPCDLINTCFDVTASGNATVSRSLPPPTRLGLVLSFAAVLIALLAIAIPWSLRRATEIPERAVANASAPAP